MNRAAPQALGTRPIPVGKPNCLAGYTFVLSGELETLTKEQTSDVIKRYGGRITGSVSGKTTFLVRGRDAGASKTAKAEKLGTKILNEDGFYELVEGEESKGGEAAQPAKKTTSKGKGKKDTSILSTPDDPSSRHQLWTEKYKPQSVEEILGNKELVRKISTWLEHWQENMAKGFPANADKDGLSAYRAMLLSGPPGIGKTTTAHVVAKTYGYAALEFNASDVRSKQVLKNETRMLKGKKVVLIMDEVDGMSGGDRGGSAELASLIRKAKIPVICICNDVRSTKVQPLLRVCYDARFKREQLELDPNALDQLVHATGNDIRQILNILSTFRLKETSMDYDRAKAVGKSNEKYSQMTLFDIPLALLSQSSWRSKTLSQKSDVYFHDYNMAHLMMFDNYTKSDPEKAKNRVKEESSEETDCRRMELIAQAAEAMGEGDLVDRMMHGSVQHWSLLPVHAILSCVRPASYMEGSLAGNRLTFPQWLGQNSKKARYIRELQDVQNRMRMRASGDKFEIRHNYVPTLIQRIFVYLKDGQYDEAFKIMDEYGLSRENLDTLNDLEIASKKPMSKLPSEVRTTFTKLYNKREHPVLFQSSGMMKKQIAIPTEDVEGTIFGEDEDDGTNEEENAADEASDEDVSKDKLIKETSPKKRPAPAAAAAASSRRTKKQKA
ncbi:replication factor RFC1 C terminal domain-containing protein [Radiomyces spectabilis]|uniref:replication factor RFC1 C terminal domain-containing protein n=1 Tax=Radiomyces spectabilis TaxID=64574 RepID=UPI00222071F4|nr:replication factor RFC1 C terminal domain-containing protein [Radiomyces spectabilis]KAI8388177.1 replication factor RFC1 C terminal domain-containing protein [Radiomyces spectabilis]